MAFDTAQRGVMRNMMIALAVSLIVLLGMVWWQPSALVPAAPMPDRLGMALRWDVVVLICLVASIGNLARHRFFTPADIDGSGLTAGTNRAKTFQAVIQNTLEQGVIAVLAHLVWAATMPLGWLAAVPAAAVLFLIGRVCFATGYAGGAASRAFGFALTFYPTVILTLIALGTLLWRAVGG